MALSPEQKKARDDWKHEEKLKRDQAKLDEIKRIQEEGDGIYSGPLTAEEAEAQDDWKKLQNLARLKFPAHIAQKFDLSPQQRSVAVAYCLGWSMPKIVAASKLSKSTVWRYLSENDTVKEFSKAFTYHNDPKDVKQVIDGELYASLQVLKDLRDDPSVSSSTRADTAKWFWEQKFGKAKETKEVRGVDLRKLTEELNKQNELIDEIEDEKAKAN